LRSWCPGPTPLCPSWLVCHFPWAGPSAPRRSARWCRRRARRRVKDTAASAAAGCGRRDWSPRDARIWSMVLDALERPEPARLGSHPEPTPVERLALQYGKEGSAIRVVGGSSDRTHRGCDGPRGQPSRSGMVVYREPWVGVGDRSIAASWRAPRSRRRVRAAPEARDHQAADYPRATALAIKKTILDHEPAPFEGIVFVSAASHA
jgi:hypothetical protein